MEGSVIVYFIERQEGKEKDNVWRLGAFFGEIQIYIY